MTAAARALHRDEPPPWVLDDVLAIEPMVQRFRPEDIEQLRRLGFTSIEHFGPEEAIGTYFPGRDEVTFGGAQRIVTATVA